MSNRFLRPGLLVAAWAGVTLALYVGLFGFGALTAGLDVQMHNTFFLIGPATGLLVLALLLAPLAGTFYLLLLRRPKRRVAWVIGLLALGLLYFSGGAIEGLAHLVPVARFRTHQGYAPGQVPAGSSLLRLLPVLRVLQVLLGIVALLAGRALGWPGKPPTTTPDSRVENRT
jgi:apolipoprotein N-acyltransferase